MKNRLDKHLHESGLSDSREKARREILSGWVKVNGETVRDVSKIVNGSEEISVNRPGGIFISRGGEKLRKALDFFNIDVNGLVCADLGASTGGFTDCMLKRGAAKVFAVDVGYGQLDYSLRKDSRVVVMERFNAKNISREVFGEKIDFFTSDLSFISFTKVYPAIKNNFPGAFGVSLIKPQFECEPGETKKGIVRESSEHVRILKKTFDALYLTGIEIIGVTFSPIKGPKGNIEFLIYYRVPSGQFSDKPDFQIESLVASAHDSLNGVSDEDSGA